MLRIGCATLAISAFALARAVAGELDAQFIGNMAFHVTDGRTSLLTDFPYEPGYAGYMRWTPDQVPKTSEHTLCLVTHGHRDHFDRERFAAMKAAVVGPREVRQGFEARALAMAAHIEYHGITVEPVATRHGDREHYSYRVGWNGLRLYFTGDTDDVEPLLREKGLDVAFVSPWLLEAARKRGARIGAKSVVVYHHAEQYMGPDYQKRLLPKQGERLRLTAAGAAIADAPPDRTVAVTFDDLPAPPSGVPVNDLATVREVTRKLLDAFRAHAVPVVGFVNEGKLSVDGGDPSDVEERSGILKMWVDAGFELGNHSYSHKSLNTTPLPEFQADVVRGEPVTRRLLGERGRSLRYFRHPFLHVGLELEKRRAFEAFLSDRGYVVAPVTVDNADYMFAAVYADALRRGDAATTSRASREYVEYMRESFAFVEDVSRRLVGREIPQVLLLHANALNGDHFGALAGAIKDRGYRFVALSEVLEDEVYRRPDEYVGAWGVSWLHHWELTEGRERSPSPDPPPWISERYQALSR
jgi:peptidoglycan/xylan/chitin deacetylase (PgdA/CDA1 family)/L-ascorbate metabolism protein UlaG (beta-lactamase superfamily)